MRQWQTITRQLGLNVASLNLPRELNEAARKRERSATALAGARAAAAALVCLFFVEMRETHANFLLRRLASKILKITQAHTKEAAAKSWRRNNLEAMEMPVDDDDASDGGEVGKEEEFVQRLKRKSKEEQVRAFSFARALFTDAPCRSFFSCARHSSKSSRFPSSAKS